MQTRILVIRPSALGDVFRTTPALVAMRQSLADACIDCIVPEGLQDALRHHPAVDRVIGFARREFARAWRSPRGLSKFRALTRTLRARRYDVAFDFQGLARSGLLTFLTGAPRRVGFANARELGWLGYNRRHHVDLRLHHVDRLLRLLAAEGIAPSEDARLYVGAEDERWADDRLAEQGWTDQPYACLAPTSQWLCKCWPRDRFGQIGRRLIDHGVAGGRLVILHGPGQHAYIRPLLVDLTQGGRDSRVMAPTTTVGQLMALIRRCRLVVSNDSAVAHAAVGFAKPAACIFGPTDPALVGPFRRDDTVVRPATRDGLGSLGFYRRQGTDQTLISQVTVEAVWERIQQQMDAGAEQGPQIDGAGGRPVVV